MGSRRRLAGTRWRFLAHGAPTQRGGMYGPPIKLQSDDQQPSVFDELVVDEWFHIEQQNRSQWWMNVAGVTLWVTVSRDGRPLKVHVYGPGDYAQPRDGCEYVDSWSDA